MYLKRIEETRNLFRYYRLRIVPGLFGNWGLLREWGRIGSTGRSRTDWFDSETDAKDALSDLQMKKAERGYE